MKDRWNFWSPCKSLTVVKTRSFVFYVLLIYVPNPFALDFRWRYLFFAYLPRIGIFSLLLTVNDLFSFAQIMPPPLFMISQILYRLPFTDVLLPFQHPIGVALLNFFLRYCRPPNHLQFSPRLPLKTHEFCFATSPCQRTFPILW